MKGGLSTRARYNRNDFSAQVQGTGVSAAGRLAAEGLKPETAGQRAIIAQNCDSCWNHVHFPL